MPWQPFHHGLKFGNAKTSEYLSRASECRELARSASPSRREELEHMAATYEQLAEMRKRRLQLNEKVQDGEKDVRSRQASASLATGLE